MTFNCKHVFVIALVLTCQSAAAQQFRHTWPCDLAKGDCWGVVKYSVQRTFWRKIPGSFEWLWFTNGDLLTVDRTKEPNIKILRLHDGPTFFQGIDLNKIDEKASGEDGSRTLTNTLLLMITAYPNGIQSMPDQWMARDVAYEQKTFHVAVRKLSKVSFDFRYSDDRDWDVSGTWSMERRPPLNDSYSLDGWKNQGGFRTLGEARKFTQSHRVK